MEEVTTVQARSQFSDVVNRVAYGKTRIVLTRRGRAIAAVVPVEDVELLDELEARIDLAAARKALASVEREGTVPWENLKAELGL